MNSSPSWNWVSVPEMRGPPSLRIVAIVLCLWASKRCLTRSASSGAAAANSDQVAIAASRWRAARAGVQPDVENDQHVRDGGSPAGTDRRRAGRRSTSRSTARRWRARVHFSRDHLDRLLAAATGESPVALRRRLLLERAAWQLRTGAASASRGGGRRRLRVAGGVLARVRAGVRRAAVVLRGRGAAGGAERHPLPPARGPADPGRRAGVVAISPTGSSRTTSTACASCSRRRRLPRRGAAARAAARVRRRLVRGRGGERVADVRAARVHARGVGGGDGGRAGAGGRRARGSRASSARRWRSSGSAKRIRDRGGYDDAFVDALCEPPRSFTYGGVLAHVITSARCGARCWPRCCSSWAPRSARATRSSGRTLRARGSGWPGTRRRPEGRRGPAGRCSRSAGGGRV